MNYQYLIKQYLKIHVVLHTKIRFMAHNTLTHTYTELNNSTTNSQRLTVPDKKQSGENRKLNFERQLKETNIFNGRKLERGKKKKRKVEKFKLSILTIGNKSPDGSRRSEKRNRYAWAEKGN